MATQSSAPKTARRFKSSRTIFALVLREMETTYGRSPGGYLWAVLEPVAGIALLTFLFSLAFRAPPIGSNFAMFYATGMLPFLCYMDVSQKLSQSLRFSQQLMFYPGVTFVDALAARFILNYLTQIMVFYILIFGIIAFYDTRTILDLPAILLSLAMAGVLAAGVGTLNCFLLSIYPLWERMWAILNRPMFIISCIFFTFENVPNPYRDILWYNPLIHIVGGMRGGFYPGYDTSYVSAAYVFGVGLVLLAIGLALLKRFHRDILNF